MKKLFIVAIAALAMTSCVSKKELLAIQTQYGILQDKYNAASNDLASSRATISSLEERLRDCKETNGQLQASLASSLSNAQAGSANISKLVDEINASNKYIKQLTDAKAKSDSLNLALSNKLTRSLSREEMKDVDVQVLKGVVYISLNDNMLYKSGSWEINSVASETLSKIAKIITDYKDYDVLIEGNTDNVPISAKNIRNNWDLSCLRAASVVMELQTKYGVNPARMTAGGRGEYNPVQDNDTEVGRSKNRRTQIIITPKLDQFMDLIDQKIED